MRKARFFGIFVVSVSVGACAAVTEDGAPDTGSDGAPLLPGVGGAAGVTGGAPGLPGAGGTSSGGFAAGVGGTVAGSGGAASGTPTAVPITGAWIDAGGNTVGIQGSFFVLEDSVQNGVPAAGGTNLTPDTFGEGTAKPCVSGTVAQVTCSNPPTNTEGCNYSVNWGGGIGVNLNESGGEPSTKSPYNATAQGVTGFTFSTSGTAGGATVRFKAKDSANPDDDFCTTITVGGSQSIALSSLVHNCYEGGVATKTLNPASIMQVEWQLVTDTMASYTVTNFCIESFGVLK